MAAARWTALAGALALVAPVAAAQEFEPPEGCELFLTVQMQGCLVSNHFRCEGDPEGHQRHVTFREGGASSASLVDEEYQWLETAGPNRLERLGLPIEDPASLTTLIETGEDTFDFTMIDVAGEEPEEFRIIGVDRLEGGEVEIDGETLRQTAFAMRRLDAAGEEVLSVSGQQFVSEELRLFFAGEETVRIDGREVEADHTPVRFLRPGEPGFGDTVPAYGCQVTDIALPAPLAAPPDE